MLIVSIVLLSSLAVGDCFLKIFGRPNYSVGVSMEVEFCSSCSSLHMDYYPHNYRLFLEVEEWEKPFLGFINDDMCSNLFSYVISYISIRALRE